MREEGVEVEVDKEAVGKLKVEVEEEEGRGRAESRWKRRGAAAAAVALLVLLLLSGSRAEEGNRRIGMNLLTEKETDRQRDTHTHCPTQINQWIRKKNTENIRQIKGQPGSHDYY